MNPKELRNVALSAMDYDSCTDEMIDTMAKHILDTVRDNDDDRLTAKSVLAHPDYEKQEFVEYGEADFSYWIGEVEFVWYSDDEFTVKMFDAELYPQPTTWGELRYLAKMLNAKLESS